MTIEQASMTHQNNKAMQTVRTAMAMPIDQMYKRPPDVTAPAMTAKAENPRAKILRDKSSVEKALQVLDWKKRNHHQWT